MINWFINNSIITGVITTLLMWLDWILTVAQEKERKEHYYKHYESYPINTIEGNHLVRKDIEKLKIIDTKHILFAILIGIFISIYIPKLPIAASKFFIGFVWGLFLVVITQHISNLISYKLSRKGIHGKIFMHLRTGYYIQSARYFSIFIFLLILSILVDNLFLYGVSLAALFSSLRMFIWLKRIPKIEDSDTAPKN
jgi:hypothetical protein